MPRSVLIDGRRRGFVTLPGYRLGMKPPNAGKKYPAEVLTRREVGKLLAACSRRGHCGIRNRALIVVLWRAGLRIAEALDLLPKDVDLEAGTIAVLHGKGDRRRIVGIDPEAAAVIEQWIVRRRELGIGPSKPLFCTVSGSTRGRPLYSSYVRESLKELAVKARIEKRVHPHGLRHTHASELAREGVPLHIIRRQLGHADLNMTARYIEHLSPQEVIDAMQRRQWATHESPPAGGQLLELERAGATGERDGERTPRSRPATAALAA
jgi:integrase/recombinase XerD